MEWLCYFTQIDEASDKYAFLAKMVDAEWFD